MNPVTVSPKFQVVIPQRIRERMRIRPGQKMQVMEIDGIIQFIPAMTIDQARGFLGKIDTSIPCELDREFAD